MILTKEKTETEKPAEEKAEISKEKPAAKEAKMPEIKLFGKWPCDVTVNDLGLKKYVNLNPRFLPRSAGAYRKRFHKSKTHIVERLALHLMVPGHTGKRHRLSSGRFGGSFYNAISTIEKAFDIIEKREKKNPLEVFIRALENAALREEVTSYQLGSIVARDAVITAPQRRVDRTLRNFANGSYKRAFSGKKKIANTLAEELLSAYKGSNESFAIKERERLESEASGSR